MPPMRHLLPAPDKGTVPFGKPGRLSHDAERHALELRQYLTAKHLGIALVGIPSPPFPHHDRCNMLGVPLTALAPRLTPMRRIRPFGPAPS